MSRFQRQAIAICFGINMLDGFDVLVMAFTAPAVSSEWSLSGAQLGVLLSAGLFGMAGGSLLLAPWADRFGRRAIILLSLALIAVSMTGSAYAAHITELATLRILTGVGVGGILASMSVITAEYASDRWRSTAIAIMTTGFTVGATLGGAIAAWLIQTYGWRSAFGLGAVLSALLLPLVMWRLPESLDFLLARRPHNALRKLNRLLQLMQKSTLQRLPELEVTTSGGAQSAARLLTARPALRNTVLIWAAFFLLMSSFFFVMSWTPKLLVEAGMSARDGVAGGVLLNVGGIVGGTLFAALLSRVSLAPLTMICLLAAAASTVAFGALGSRLAFALAIAVVLGALMLAAMAGLYSLALALYPAAVRTTGLGWAIGVGRVGAILAPLVVGVLVDGGWQPASLYYLFAVPLLLAVLAVCTIHVRAEGLGHV